jgi:hypothetical protein
MEKVRIRPHNGVKDYMEFRDRNRNKGFLGVRKSKGGNFMYFDVNWERGIG